ncbi:hypothetical protein C4D60_Mb05t29800 [Musa balbisiana]|uniref:Rad21/Rec8-like protein N-terminal domain-containing protein n=1 Tax=Musa balbisiana TaxID=52838 RepID=A0A4S8JZT1_MUSBA|nr:hypothetical protein C4D60_Mb05t29800 [Musa balbisiana]
MFYSHQLLARKAPLGQIWMAATMRAKMNRRKLDKLDIIKIWYSNYLSFLDSNRSIHSWFLSGGVVIVYERKVKLLYDDVTRFLVILEVSRAFVSCSSSSSSELVSVVYANFNSPMISQVEINAAWKVKTVSDPTVLPRAKAQAKFEAVTLPEYVDMEPEQPMMFPDASIATAAFQRMRLDDLEEQYINIDLRDDDLAGNDHQDSAVENHQTEEKEEQRANAEDVQRQQPVKRKAHRKPSHRIMDDRQLMIPGNIYQLWLQDTSDIVSKRGRTVMQCLRSVNPIRSTKISNLMDLPPVALISGLEMFPAKVHYPAPLMELWRKCTEVNISPSGDKSPVAQQQEVTETVKLLEEVQGEIGSNSLDVSIEKLRANLENLDFQGFDDAFSIDHFVTPGSSGQSSKSMPSSGSGHAFMPLEPEIQLPSVRSKRKQHSSSKSFRNLDPVEEELPLQQDVRGSKIRRLSETSPSPDFVLVTCDFIKVQQHEAYGDISISRGPKM